jgi:hypothetical protein
MMSSTFSNAQTTITPDEARAIAKEAYIYGYPIVDNYRVMHDYFVNSEGLEYRGSWNELHHIPRVYTPDDKAVQTPNSDTPYSMLALDLRAEPFVLTVPPMEKDRYFSIQLVDLYTHNFDYLGSRATGNDGGIYLIAGPGWKGKTPKGVNKVFHCETELMLAIYRTQLFNPGDLDNVKNIMTGYAAQPLSQFLGQPAPKSPPAIEFIEPPTKEELQKSLKVFHLTNFLLQFCPPHPSEKKLMERFARIGIGAGMTFDVSSFSPEVMKALGGGIADAWADFAHLRSSGEAVSGDIFGTREYLKNNYLYRMGAAVLGIYGNSIDEAMYPGYYEDADGQELDGANRYTMRFAPGQLPPVHAFWSLTMYEMPASLLIENPLNRYLLNSPMLPQFKRDADGGLTFYLQNESPGKDKESNWLPAPKGPFCVIMRLYWPKNEAVEGEWEAPPVQKL